jgi:hypothetical protein
MYSRDKDISRRVGYLLAAEVANLKDMFLDRARDFAKAQDQEVDPQDAAVAGFKQASEEYRALVYDTPAALPTKSARKDRS